MRALIFDLDGTLLNTIGDLHNSTNFALQKFGFPLRTLDEVNSFVGNGMEMLIRHAVPQGTSEEIIKAVLHDMKAHYALHYHDLTVPYKGIMEMLQTCKEKAIPMAIVSNKADPFVKKLSTLYFKDLISIAMGETPDIPRKPAPDMIFSALDQLGIKKEEAYYVGDSEVDVLTAKNAGLPCLSVTWGFRTEEQICKAGATEIVHSPEELLQKIL